MLDFTSFLIYMLLLEVKGTTKALAITILRSLHYKSVHNRTKTVALWKKLAEKFATDTTIAGYDLINEPNWNLPGGSLLRSLYEDITDSIRAVDTNHIIFIEGNWFANTFTSDTLG